MICPNCGTALPEGTKFCTECGKQIPSEPTQIINQDVVQPRDSYCPNCGKMIPAIYFDREYRRQETNFVPGRLRPGLQNCHPGTVSQSP